MPNHVTTHLTVAGPEGELFRFHNAIDFDSRNDGGIVRAFLPFPKELEGEEILGNDGTTVIGRAFSEEGYQWCLDTWGTKWGDYETEEVFAPYERADTDGEWVVAYRYDSAWSSADVALLSISAMFPHLLFLSVWEEEGYQSMGAFACRNGLYGDALPPEIPMFSYSEDDDDDSDAIEQFYEEWSSKLDLMSSISLATLLGKEARAKSKGAA